MLRSQTVRGIRKNFSGMYGGATMCPLCSTEPDTQEHILQCHRIQEIETQLNDDVTFSDVFKDVTRQKKAVQEYLKALKARDSLLVEEGQHSLPGLHNTGPTPARTARTRGGREDNRAL